MPESSAPQSSHGVPPQGGNGGLIAVGVIMLLLAGGLVYWKSSSAPKEPEVVEETATKVEKPKAEPEAFDNAPPPPPDEEEEAPKEEEKKPTAGQNIKPTGPAGCSGDCKGNATPALQSALAARGAMARSCYNTALRNNPNLKGKMTMSVRVSPSGSVCSAHVSENSLGDQAVASCAAAKFRAGTFPPPTGGCVNVNVPLNFTANP
jgi:hypothetical protein